MWNKLKPATGLSKVWAMLLHWTHWLLRVECSTTQHFILCNKELSLSLLSSKQHLLSWLQAQWIVLWGLMSRLSVRNRSTSYSWAVILPYCLVYQKHLYWHVAETQLCHMYWAGNSTWLRCWSPAWKFWPGEPPSSTLFAIAERWPTALHHYPEQHTPFKYQGTFCLTYYMLCWSYLLSHAACHSTL